MSTMVWTGSATEPGFGCHISDAGCQSCYGPARCTEPLNFHARANTMKKSVLGDQRLRRCLLRAMSVAAVVGLTSHLALAADCSHSWVSAKYAPCEGIGVAGVFRSHISGTASAAAADGTKTVNVLAVHASSAAFTQGDPSVAARAIVKLGGAVKQEVVLVRPTPPFVEAATKPDESRQVYLPPGKTLSIPPKGEFVVSVSAIVKTPGGVCALGSTEDKVGLP